MNHAGWSESTGEATGSAGWRVTKRTSRLQLSPRYSSVASIY